MSKLVSLSLLGLVSFLGILMERILDLRVFWPYNPRTKIFFLLRLFACCPESPPEEEKTADLEADRDPVVKLTPKQNPVKENIKNNSIPDNVTKFGPDSAPNLLDTTFLEQVETPGKNHMLNAPFFSP